MITKREDIEHNHDTKEKMVYAGFSQVAPAYHLFVCSGVNRRPRWVVEFIPFDKNAFSDPESKAYRGNCSMRRCYADAVVMDVETRLAYCERCQAKYSDTRVPCLYTRVFLCREGLNRGLTPDLHRHCAMCAVACPVDTCSQGEYV